MRALLIPGRALRTAALAGLLLTLPLAAQPPRVEKADQALLDSQLRPRAARSLLLDATRVGNGYVAVGERGHVLLSRDGTQWTQVDKVPTRSTLTAVTAVGNDVWAGGHDGIILHSGNAGRTWTRQRVAVGLRADDPTHGVPVLDLWFRDANNGLAIGAYQLMLRTQDGGKTWTPVDLGGQDPSEPAVPAAQDDDELLFTEAELQMDEVADPHLNAIASTGAGTLIVVGERGSLFRSTDSGATWQRSRFPYGGSMFGALGFEGDRVLAFGMRGNVFESRDGGKSWNKLESGTRANLMGGTPLKGGGAVLVGSQGAVLVRANADAPLRARSYMNTSGETPGLAAVLAIDKEYVVFGERGADRFIPTP